MEEASDGIVVLDRDGYYRMANAKVCDMFGYRREELLQLHMTDTYVPAEKDMLSNASNNFLRSTCALHAGYSEKMGRSFRSTSVHRRCPTIATLKLSAISL